MINLRLILKLVILFTSRLIAVSINASPLTCSQVFTNFAIDKTSFLREIAKLQIAIQFSGSDRRVQMLEKFNEQAIQITKVYGCDIFKSPLYIEILKSEFELTKINLEKTKKLSKQKRKKLKDNRIRAISHFGEPKTIHEATSAYQNLIFSQDSRFIVFESKPNNTRINILDRKTNELNYLDLNLERYATISDIVGFKNDPKKFVVFVYGGEPSAKNRIIVINEKAEVLNEIVLPELTRFRLSSTAYKRGIPDNNFLVVGVEINIPPISPPTIEHKFLVFNLNTGEIVNSREASSSRELAFFIYDNTGKYVITTRTDTDQYIQWEYLTNNNVKVVNLPSTKTVNSIGAIVNSGYSPALSDFNNNIYFVKNVAGVDGGVVRIKLNSLDAGVEIDKRYLELRLDRNNQSIIQQSVILIDNRKNSLIFYNIANDANRFLTEIQDTFINHVFDFDSRIGYAVLSKRQNNGKQVHEIQIYNELIELIATYRFEDPRIMINGLRLDHESNELIVITRTHADEAYKYKIQSLPIVWADHE